MSFCDKKYFDFSGEFPKDNSSFLNRLFSVPWGCINLFGAEICISFSLTVCRKNVSFLEKIVNVC